MGYHALSDRHHCPYDKLTRCVMAYCRMSSVTRWFVLCWHYYICVVSCWCYGVSISCQQRPTVSNRVTLSLNDGQTSRQVRKWLTAVSVQGPGPLASAVSWLMKEASVWWAWVLWVCWELWQCWLIGEGRTSRLVLLCNVCRNETEASWLASHVADK